MTTETLQAGTETVVPEQTSVTVEAPAAVVVETPAVETPAAEVAVAEHTATPTLLSEVAEEKPAETPAEEKPEDKPAEEKPAEVKEEAKPEDKPAEVVAEVPAEAPVALTVADFTLPEGVTADNEKLGAFAAAANEAGLSKETAQRFVDMHAQAMQSLGEHTLSEQHRAFGETRAQWRRDVMADEQIGGAGHKTAMAAIARMRDMLVPERDRAQFNEFLLITGAGDHPAMLKLLHNAARHFDEGPAIPASKPPPDIGKAPGKKGMRSLYDKTGS